MSQTFVEVPTTGRMPDPEEVGPPWTERGRPPADYFTKRTAEDWLRDVIDQARRGTLPALVRIGATLADRSLMVLDGIFKRAQKV
jgi:hypothetical protein